MSMDMSCVIACLWYSYTYEISAKLTLIFNYDKITKLIYFLNKKLLLINQEKYLLMIQLSVKKIPATYMPVLNIFLTKNTLKSA